MVYIGRHFEYLTYVDIKIQDVMIWLGYSKCIKCVQYVYFTNLFQSIEILHHTQIKVTCSAGPNSVGLGSNFVCALPHFYSWIHAKKILDKKMFPKVVMGC